ncbi:hypothetical protein E2C01_003956 [Portunus trituberculatus]|uniref:Uncharacterized protein n=1 Tax=Portunus trituberculatus TaxID=210409 RepID=A0A5B7CRK4_PORTR|nr:hypothetical protein [Portunus trituberculatus]
MWHAELPIDIHALSLLHSAAWTMPGICFVAPMATTGTTKLPVEHNTSASSRAPLHAHFGAILSFFRGTNRCLHRLPLNTLSRAPLDTLLAPLCSLQRTTNRFIVGLYFMPAPGQDGVWGGPLLLAPTHRPHTLFEQRQTFLLMGRSLR